MRETKLFFKVQPKAPDFLKILSASSVFSSEQSERARDKASRTMFRACPPLVVPPFFTKEKNHASDT